MFASEDVLPIHVVEDSSSGPDSDVDDGKPDDSESGDSESGGAAAEQPDAGTYAAWEAHTRRDARICSTDASGGLGRGC